MGPPLVPASAMRVQRPRTPNRPMSPASVSSYRGGPTPRAQNARPEAQHGTAEVQSPTRSAHHSRKSSVSSFASELDTRFNIQNGMGFDPQDLAPTPILA